MALSADEEKLLADLTAKSQEPDSLEMWVRDDESRQSILVSGANARKLLQKFGLADEESAEPDPAGGKPDPKEPKPPSGHKFFS